MLSSNRPIQYAATQDSVAAQQAKEQRQPLIPYTAREDPFRTEDAGLTGGLAGVASHPPQPDPREVPIVLYNLEAMIEDLMKSVAQLEQRLSPVLLSAPEQANKEQSRVMGCDLAGRLSNVALVVGRVTAALNTIEARVQL